MGKIQLGVNIDHVATLRQARGTNYPDPVEAAFLAIEGGADGITLHLREDRRHIQDRDVKILKEKLTVPMNLEMAATEEMVNLALALKPEKCCLVPEKRQELTTEGGLDVAAQQAQIANVCERLAKVGIEVSLFIDAEEKQIDAAKKCGAPVIEIHTGHYAEADETSKKTELKRVVYAAEYAHAQGLIVNAGHGLNIYNVQPISAISVMNELNIGHSIIARSIFIGLQAAVHEIKALMLESQD
ncbi:pyridoxine 5'-phosphate synthase [Candidiatus Paracoxiella cheracis]|uniref:pyridoxine 5'-phosphate synthase n=1 Tax=Candidiatus Paracoxiella cheracis TaxID=3405120 RepID=UPI003BF5CCB0